jgi:predicted ester cyclase
LNITETNRGIAERFHDAFNRGNLDAAASWFSEDCQNHGRKVGRAGVRMVLGEIKTNFPDAKLTMLNSVAEDEWVVVRCTYSGTTEVHHVFQSMAECSWVCSPRVVLSRFSTSTRIECSMARSLSTLRVGTTLE